MPAALKFVLIMLIASGLAIALSAIMDWFRRR
jgi:hypothetical protein